MHTKKKNKAKKWFVIAGIIIAGIVVFTIFFNGKGLYFTFGMSSSTALKAGGESTSVMAARVLIADEKTKLLDVADDKLLPSTVNGETVDEFVKNNVKSRLSRVATLNSMAKKKGVVLSHVQKEEVDNAASIYLQGLTDEQKNNLQVSRDKLTTMFTQFKIAEEMKNYLLSDDSIEVSTDEARVISVLYIVNDSEEEINKALNELKEGKPFYDVAANYNSDEAYTAELRRGDMQEEFENAAYALKSGEVSDVVSCDGKFYIIKCSSDNEQSKTDANKEYLLEKKRNEAFEEVFLPYENDTYIEINNSQWEKINVENITVTSVLFDDIYRQYID